VLRFQWIRLCGVKWCVYWRITNWRGCGKNWSWPILSCCSGSCLEGLSKYYDTLRYNRPFSGRNLKPGPLEYSVLWVLSICRKVKGCLLIWTCISIWLLYTRGADKSLARPGRKQARKHVRDARDFNNIETRAVKHFFSPVRQGAEGNWRHCDRNISLFPSWSG